MKHLILILLFISASFSFEDILNFSIIYEKIEHINMNRINSANIPAPHTSYLVDHENIENTNTITSGHIVFNVFPLTDDSIRHMEYYKTKRGMLEGMTIYSQFDRVDSSWIEKDNGRLKITIWPRLSASEDWNTSLVLYGDSTQDWDVLETTGVKFSFKQTIYNGTNLLYPDYSILTGTAELKYSRLYDREAYADSIAVIDSIRVADSLAVADSIKAYEDSVFAYEDSVRIADSIAVADSIKAYEDSMKTSIAIFRKKESLKYLNKYDILGRRVNWVGRIKKILK